MSSTIPRSPSSASGPWSSCPAWSATTPPWPSSSASSASPPPSGPRDAREVGQLRYLGVGAGTGAVIPPLGSTYDAIRPDQTSPEKICALVDLGLLNCSRGRSYGG